MVLLTLTFVLCTLMISLAMPNTKVEAKEKSYTIDNFDANVSFDYNGDAYITEKWTLTFDGEYSRFYKDFRLYDLTTVEDFDNFEISSVKINDVSCEYIGDELNDSRPSYTFYFYESGDNYTLQWNYPVKDSTVTYEIDYKLENVVKLSEENPDNAIFCYRFVGKNFDKNIKTAVITVENPGKTPIEIGYSTKKVDATEENNKMTIKFENSSGLVKFNLHLDSSAFSSKLITTNKKDTKAFNNREGSRSDEFENFFDWFFITIIFIIPILVMIRYIVEDKKDRKMYTKLRDNSNLLYEKLQLLENNGVHPLAVIDSVLTTPRLRAEIGWLIYRCNLHRVDDKLFLVNMDNLLDDERRLLDVLYREHQTLNGEWFIDKDNLSYILESSSLKSSIARYISNLASENYRKACNKNKEIKKTIKEIRTYFTMDYVYGIDYISSWLDSDDKLSYMDIYSGSYLEIIRSAYITSKENIVKHQYPSDMLCVLDFDDILDDEVVKDCISSASGHDSSSGSSCSSCSSCSGCGGGGAD